jgi:hypothetical protein
MDHGFMSSVILTIKSLIQEADSFETTDAWTCLKVEKPSCYLINDADLAREILKDETLLPRKVIDFWKRINRLDKNTLPHLTQYFQRTPLILSGKHHEAARDSLRPVYQSIERDLENTLFEANQHFFSAWQGKKKINITNFLSLYIDFINRTIIAKELMLHSDDIPRFDGFQLFEFMPSAKRLSSYDDKLGTLITYIQTRLNNLQRSADDAWPLASVTVMAQGPLSGALGYGLMNDAEDGMQWSGETLAFYSAPVSVFPRIVDRSLSFGDLNLGPGDLLVISPIICNLFGLRNRSVAGRSMSFGHGAHICTGRKIATKIIDLFFRDIRHHTFDFDRDGFTLKRNIMLTPVQT